MKNRTKKLLKMFVAFTCAVTMTVPGVAVSAAETEAKEVPGTDFYPVVQSMTAESEEGMKLDGAVELVIHGDQIEAAVPEIEALLAAEGIEYNKVDAVSGEKAAIVISSDAEHCDACASEDAALAEEQGYVLTASDSVNKKGQVTIVGADSEGAYYGILTLKQMFEQKTEDGRIAELAISDWPDVKLRGFVEGFYGYPWTYEGRRGLMEDCGELKMNVYIYAPKDDPYHRNQWRTLYPEAEAENIRKLVEAGIESNVSFCWSVHPGNGFNYNSDADYNAIIAKFEQLYDLGVRQFSIGYDDLGGSDYYRGKEHAQIINRVNQEFVKAKGDVKPLIVVATRYCASWGPDMNSYFKPFYSTLDSDVEVMWTGNGTMSVVSKSAYEWPKNQTGVDRDLACWWNYPVNDYCDGKLLMSPLETLYTDVDNLTGFFLNPMSQAEASKVAIFSGADYSWNIQDFDYMESWKEAIVRLVPDCNEAFERFADNLSYLKDGFEFDESRYLTDKIKALSTAVSKGKGVAEAAEALKAEFELMKEDVVAMRAMENTAMLADIETHLDAYDVLADAGIDAMTAYIAAEDGDLGVCLSSLESMKANLKKTSEFTITSLEDGGTKVNVVEVGVKRIKPMLEMADVQVQAILMDSIAPSTEGEVITNVEGVDGEVILSQGNYSVSGLTASMKADDYVGIKLPNAMKLSGIKVTGTPVDAMTVQVSLNGISWTDVEATVADGVIEVKDTVEATYVRVVCNAEAADMEISEFVVYPIYDAEVSPTVTTDLSHYQYNYISNAMDGNMNTKFYSSAGTTAGSYVMVDFGAEIPVYDTTIYYAANPKGISEGVDGFKTTKFEISTDGATWIEVGTPINFADYEVMNDTLNRCAAKFNADGQIARYMRFSATEGYDNWVQIYEIEYNKTASNLGDGVVQLVEATMDIVGAPSLYDGDFETAPVIAATKDGDTLTYAMTTTTNVEKLTILQDENAICNATVSVEKVDGTWVELGTLDVYCKTFDVYEEILTVKLTFPADVTPVIYEIIAAGPKAEKPEEPEMPGAEPVAFDTEVLVRNAKANSEQLPVAWDNDGGAGWAFDGDTTHWWHSRYQDFDQKAEWEIGSAEGDGKPAAGHEIWIQTGFEKAWFVDSITYLPRSNGHGIIKDYTVSVAKLADPMAEPTDDDFVVVKTGTLQPTAEEQTIKLDEVTEATHIRITVASSYMKGDGGDADGDGHVAARDIKILGFDSTPGTDNTDYRALLNQKIIEYGAFVFDDYTYETASALSSALVSAYFVAQDSTAAPELLKETVQNLDKLYNALVPKCLHNDTEVKDAKEATCTQAGSTGVTVCKDCGKEITAAEEIPAKGHAWGEWTVVKESTYKEEGLEEHECLDCGETEERVIPKDTTPFKDVDPTGFYFEPVLWAVENKVTSGLNETTFGVGDACTREQIVTFLWNYAGQPDAEQTDCTFKDVNPEHYYYQAMLWANENGYVSGYNKDEFGVGDPCTREQIVMILWKFAGEPAAKNTSCAFADVNPEHYYYQAMLWAVENNVAAGYNSVQFGVGDACTREQIVTYLYRYNNLEK